jgi:glycosyltransferase involved in cell wall biosynthesis
VNEIIGNTEQKDGKLKINWFSNSPLVSTGYGNQTKYFTPLLRQLGYDVSIHAFYGHEPYSAPFQWNGINITGRGFHPYGLDVIAGHAKSINADITLTLLDAWVFEPQVMKDIRWVSWFPVDHDPIPPAVLEKVRYAFDRIVYSRFGEKQMQDNDVPCHYVPHGTDTELFKPQDAEKRAQFQQMIGFPKDTFVVGMVAANKGYPSRKAFEENIAAFKMLKEKHSDVLLYLQTWTGEGGNDCVNLVDLCRDLGLQMGRDVVFCDQLMNNTTGFPDNYMAALYNSLDVLLSVSRGEGFGIPILEAQASGCPVIVGDWTSMSELCFGGWKVAKEDATRTYHTHMRSYWFVPKVEAIYEKLEAAYQMRGNMDYRTRARDGALPYDVRKVTQKYWKPVLEKIQDKIELTNRLRAQVAMPVQQTAGKPIEVKEVTA